MGKGPNSVVIHFQSSVGICLIIEMIQMKMMQSCLSESVVFLSVLFDEATKCTQSQLVIRLQRLMNKRRVLLASFELLTKKKKKKTGFHHHTSTLV